ncbi:hypothetical protein SSPO_050890 [Streptomyces antimycoticus]|uniref:Uncharacterized protein n=1 Tax=Streptomyces antimycoticus TaxID=68175 RepID=A0A499UYM1_9ACTN|nr:hypothetical protein SSPO_050890 [Streptomyces antimycoticus]
MTGPRPEREGVGHGAREPAPYPPYGSHQQHDAHGAYAGPDAFAAAGEGLRDPLADPLPDSAPAGPTGRTTGTASLAVPPPTGRRRRARPAPAGPEEAAEAAVPPTGRRRARAAPSGPSGSAYAPQTPVRAPGTPRRPSETSGRVPEAAETAVLPPVRPRGDDETVALRAVEAAPAGQTMALRKVEPDRDSGAEPPPGGRAARRKAAQEAGKRAGRHGSRARRGTAEAGATRPTEGAGNAGDAPPRTRMEAKRAARARKDSPGVVASRVVGELFITLGVVMLLFVTYQLWWTNIRAHQQANGAANNLQKKWDENGGDDRNPGTFSPGRGSRSSTSPSWM